MILSIEQIIDERRGNMLVSINEAYKTNSDFRAYVDKFCACHRTLPELAIKCIVVQNVYREYVGGVNCGR